MIRPDNRLDVQVLLCIEPVDFRKHITGLAALVQGELELDPFARQLVVFTNRRRDQCRILYWERSGFVLWSKRLEKARFAWPAPPPDTAVVTMTPEQLNLLLDGYNVFAMRPHAELRFASVY